MTLSIRKAAEDDAAAIIQLHFDAVHVTAAADYEQDILNDWSRPLAGRLEAMQEQLKVNVEQTEMFVCELADEIVGFGELAPRTNEIRAVYVAPSTSRKGVGKKLLQELEKSAIGHGLTELWLDSSLTAVPFYSSQGFVGSVESEHTLRSGKKMRCLKMQKTISSLL
jgi:N-acetylglutamate synthase-like GNAT family acetyltransferase